MSPQRGEPVNQALRSAGAVLALVILALMAVMAPTLRAQSRGKDKDQDLTVRSVEGTVSDAEERLVEGAVVHLKNTKTLQIRSFITRRDGTYAFHGLSTNIDYELRAEHQGAASDARMLSVFDSRRKAIIHLKLNKK
ncbi:MAG: carboxypeptidase regulatory-like domain-containing protein [Acidobacteria bacterium]|nr:carboxypeptidase regulatory-like domain-containing protein [Acidobacteriota bacterium]